MDNESEECPSQVENENISVNVSSGNVVFSTSKLSTGRISHHASHGALFYNHRNVLKSGRTYYECSETNCRARIYAQYTSKDASTSEELPKLIR